MTHSPTPPALAAEFDMLMARAGVTVPADRRDSMIAGYADFRAQLHLLHGVRDHLSEPSNVFAVTGRATIREDDA